jgi:uncharacterized protein (DUF58 family)
VSGVLFLIFFLVVVALLVQVDFIVYVAYVLIGVYAMSRWVVPRSLARIDVARHFHSRAFLGETVEVEVGLVNRSRLPILWLQLLESIPPELRAGRTLNQVVRLGPRASRKLRYQVRAMKRGYYRLGPMTITAGDLFGFRESQIGLRPDFLTVYPRIVPLGDRSLPSRLPFGTLASKQRLFEDPARPHGVRDYRLGDSLRLVNWKVSAHSDALLVRTHQPAISLETAILLNLDRNDYSPRFRLDGPEWAIVVAASLASHLVAQRQAVGLITNGVDPLLQGRSSGDQVSTYDESSGRLSLAGSTADGLTPADLVPDPIPPKSGRDHLMQILERLARIEAGTAPAFAPFAFQATQRLNWGVTLMVVAPNADAALCDTLHRMVRASFNVLLLVVERFVDFAAIRDRASLLGFRAVYVPDRRSLRQWQLGARHAG